MNIVLSNASHAADTLVISDDSQDPHFTGKYVDYLEDPLGELSFYQILKPDFQDKFKTGVGEEHVRNIHRSSFYWMRVYVNNKTRTQKKWVVELFDFRFDYIEAYIPDGKGNFIRYKAGSEFPFSDKIFKHKNFIFDFPTDFKGVEVFYFKVQSDRPVTLFGAIRSDKTILSYATVEYFLLALFYGVIAAMILYNLFIFFALKDLAYLFYVLYVLSIGLYALSEDGLGFQFLWFDFPQLNIFIFPLANFSMIMWALLYARYFLNTRYNSTFLDKGIVYLLIFRTIIFITWIFYSNLSYIGWIDIGILFYIYLAGVVIWLRGYSMARFYVLAFTLFFLGFFISVLNHLNLIPDTIFTVYVFNVGVFCEMILLSLALADRIKVLTAERENARLETIRQYQEKEALKDKLNSELEEKVRERTRELDEFVYRSGHDIKGPLKSIIGLTTVGLKDVDDPHVRNYFEHILKSSMRLDEMVSQLLKVIQVKEAKLEFTQVYFEKLISDILFSFKGHPEFHLMTIDVNVNQAGIFVSDEKTVYSIIQNMVENAIKYRDPDKDSFLRISVSVKEDFALLVFTDNGIGIAKDVQGKIFDMFYKANPESKGHGLGLYMTKVHIEKSQGSISMNSEAGLGTTFHIQLKNHQIKTSLS